MLSDSPRRHARPLCRASGPDRDSAFSLTSSLPTLHLRYNSNPDEWDKRAIGSYYELYAAALGNLEWLRFCLSWHREEIPADDKVRPWSLGARPEVLCTHKNLLTYLFPGKDVPVQHPQMSFSV